VVESAFGQPADAVVERPFQGGPVGVESKGGPSVPVRAERAGGLGGPVEAPHPS